MFEPAVLQVAFEVPLHVVRQYPDFLGRECRITATFRSADNRTLHVRKVTRAEPEQLSIYNALNIDTTPGGVNTSIR